MSEPLTNDELQIISKRCEAATAGPWVWEAADGSLLMLGQDIRVHYPELNGIYEPLHVLSCPRCKACQKRKDAPCLWPNKRDSDFIAHARKDIPRLLEKIQQIEGIKR